MTISHAPKGRLQPFVALVWAADGAGTAMPEGRELVLPTGMTHLVFRLGGRPLRLFADRADTAGSTVGCAVIGGARAGPYLKATAAPAPSVGALLRPGAAAAILGAPADALAGRHTPLDCVWGANAVAEIAERLNDAPSAAARLELFEAVLAARLAEGRGIDPLIAHAVMRLATAAPVGAVAHETGRSRRHFTRAFSAAVGLGPKTYCRLLRFNRVLDRLARAPDTGWAELAAAEDYADQPHFNREFRALAGVSPGGYRRSGAIQPRHVPVPFVQDIRRPPG